MFQTETLKARKLMAQILDCNESELEMSDGKVKIPSAGVSGIHCNHLSTVYSLDWVKYSRIRLRLAYSLVGSECFPVARIDQINAELMQLQEVVTSEKAPGFPKVSSPLKL